MPDGSVSKVRPTVSFIGDSGSGGKPGAVPAPATGDAAAGKFLKADATWAVPSSNDADAIHDNVGGEIDAITEKKDPVGDDIFIIEDSEVTSLAKKKLLLKNLPHPHTTKDVRVAFATVATVTIGTTALISKVSDSTDVLLMQFTGLLTANIGSSGANGLDTGSEAADTWYALHVIGDTTQTNAPASLLSLSATALTLPSGYDVFRRVGWVRNNSSSNLYDFIQYGNGSNRVYHWRESQSTVNVLTNGSATTFTNIDLSEFVPPTVILSYLNANHSAGQDNDFVRFRADGSTETEPPLRVYGGGNTDGGTVTQSQTFWQETSTSQIIEYDNSSSSEQTDVWVVGFQDEI